MLPLRLRIVTSSTIAATLTFGSLSSWAQTSERPELTGVWTNAALTRMTRPANVDKLIVSAAEAQQIIANTSVAGLPVGEFEAATETTDTVAPPAAGGDDFGLRAYNDFWIDPGSALARVKGEYRSSYIIVPENGQIPHLASPTADFERRNFGVRYATGVGDMSGPEAMPLAERCLLLNRTYGRAG